VNTWLSIARGNAPLIISVPHAGTDLPAPFAGRLFSAQLARADTDWHVDRLYEFATGLGATVIRTDISRTIIDVNRDPSGASLYPGQATTGLCPVTIFGGEGLYAPGDEPDDAEIEARRAAFFDPYHTALDAEIARLRTIHPAIVVYDAHSIASRVPRLFDGALPQFNIGTNGGVTCALALTTAVARHCGKDTIVDGRFRGGWITRRLGDPANGVHAIQMELAQRGYLDEPGTGWDAARAEPLQSQLRAILITCINFARESS
jgi:N-formylglutamate deformylase